MPEPFNYMQGFKPPDLAADFLKGMQIGEMSRRNDLEAQQRQQAALIAEQKRKEQQAMQAEIGMLGENPTLEGMRKLVIKYPSLATPYKEVMNSLSEEQKTNLKGQAWNVFSAVEQGNIPAAIEMLTKIRDSARNAGQTAYADGADLQLKMLASEDTGEAGNKAVLLGAGTFLAAADPENYAKYMEERRKQAEAPSKLSKAQADAMISQNKASYGEDKQTLNTQTGIYERNAKGEWVNTGLKPFAQPQVQLSLGEGQKGFENETTLRKEFNAEAKPFNEVAASFSRLSAASKDDSGASDIAMIYSYMKMLDPGSVVREGEFATAENAGGVGEKIRNLYNKAIQGTRLTPKVREDYLSVAKRLHAESRVKFNKLKGRYTGIAKRASLNPENVTTIEEPESEGSTSATSVDELMKLLGK